MRAATNTIGWNVEVHTPEGWRAASFQKPHASRELAQAAMDGLRAAAPGVEYRVYEALTGGPSE